MESVFGNVSDVVEWMGGIIGRSKNVKESVMDGIVLYEMVDSLHTCINFSSWDMTRREVMTKRSRVGWDINTFKYVEYLHWYYISHHSVDNNNNNHMGCLKFET